jgi:N-acetylmuramoyl-L-alanine amidase
MKKSFFILFLTLPLLCYSLQKKENNNKKYIVVLDPGHGGFNNGTISKNNIKEKDLNLFVAQFSKYYLEQYSKNVEVVLTRNKDVFIPLKKRPLYAKISKADLFISIHCNHNPNIYANGLEIYIQNNKKNELFLNTKKAENYATILNKIVTEKLDYKSRGIKYDNFSVLRNSIEFVPSVLIELGFFSNKNEEKYLTSKKGINGLSLAIAKSIIKYFE